jgi:hypothetical protein
MKSLETLFRSFVVVVVVVVVFARISNNVYCYGNGCSCCSPAVCVYNGVNYNQGQTWDDGCDRKCRCEDAEKGLYVCDNR